MECGCVSDLGARQECCCTFERKHVGAVRGDTAVSLAKITGDGGTATSQTLKKSRRRRVPS